MHVVQPYPTRWKPSACRYGVRPARSRYRVTTFDPGARLVFTHGRVLQPPLHRLLRQETRADHHRGVRGVRAAGDRRDHHRPVMQVVHSPVQAERSHARRPRSRAGSGSLPAVPPPSPSHRSVPSSALAVRGSLPHEERASRKAALHPESGTRSWGRLRARQARLHRGQVEGQRVGEDGVPRLPGAEEPLGLAVRLHQLHLRLVAPREEEVFERLVVHREEPDRGAVLRGHVRDRRPVGHRQGGEPLPVELHELSHHALRAQHLRDREDEVGGGGAFGSFPGEPEPHHLGNEHGDRLPEHRRLRLDPSDAPADHSQPVDHRRVGVGPDEGVGERLRPAADPSA